MNSDFKDLLSLFNQYNVRYLVVGGYAVMFYTEPRYTKDLDVVIGSSEEDIAGTGKVLTEFGFPTTPEHLEALKEPNKMIVLGRPPNRIDILNEISGVDFDAAFERRKEVRIGGEICWFLSLEDLIATKKAANRPQDQRDLVALRKELELKKNSNH